MRADRPLAQAASGRAASRPALAMRSSSRNLSGRRTDKVHYHDRVSRAQTNIAVLAEKPSHEINPTWKQWRRDTLPMLPSRWPLVVCEKTKHQFVSLVALFSSRDTLWVLPLVDRWAEGSG